MESSNKHQDLPDVTQCNEQQQNDGEGDENNADCCHSVQDLLARSCKQHKYFVRVIHVIFSFFELKDTIFQNSLFVFQPFV